MQEQSAKDKLRHKMTSLRASRTGCISRDMPNDASSEVVKHLMDMKTPTKHNIKKLKQAIRSQDSEKLRNSVSEFCTPQQMQLFNKFSPPRTQPTSSSTIPSSSSTSSNVVDTKGVERKRLR